MSHSLQAFPPNTNLMDTFELYFHVSARTWMTFKIISTWLDDVTGSMF